MRQELSGFDSLDGILDQLTELPPLFVSDRGAEVLNFDEPLADKDHLSHFRDASNP
jgi:hypothetical protein